MTTVRDVWVVRFANACTGPSVLGLVYAVAAGRVVAVTDAIVTARAAEATASPFRG